MSTDARSLACSALSGVLRPTTINTPSVVNRPTTMASGLVTGPITAPITPSVSSGA